MSKSLFHFNYNSIIIIGLFIILFASSCKEPLGLDNVKISQAANAYMPMNEGYYWVYENNSNGTISIDSVVITGKKEIGGREAYEYTTFRNSQEFQKTFFFTDQRKVYLYSIILEPLLDTASCGCPYRWEQNWKSIANFDNAWSTQDTAIGDTYPSLVDDGSGNFHTIMTKTFHLLNLNGDKGYAENVKNFDSIYNTYTYSFKGNWLYQIDTSSAKVEFKNMDGYRYLNGFTLIFQEMNMQLWFSKDIGIVKTEGSILDYKNELYTHSRKLLRYSVK